MSSTHQRANAAVSKLPTAIGIGLVVVAVLSLALAGYNFSNPHATTVTQQQLVTNNQNFYQTQILMSFATVTNVVTTTHTVNSYGYGYNYYQYCGYYGCYYSGPPGYSFNPPCQPMGSNTYQCSGWLYKDGEGCIDLIIPVANRFGYQVYEYYALHNLPTSYPALGSWVTVHGQVYQGYSTGPTGGACPNNYVNVTSIT